MYIDNDNSTIRNVVC